MSDSFEMRPIARIRSDFGSKFGVPRQSGLVDALEAAVVFEAVSYTHLTLPTIA